MMRGRCMERSRGVGGHPRAVSIDESRSGVYRPHLSDVSKMREVAAVRMEGSRFSVELLMENDPPVAIATHRREDRPWPEETTAAHLRAWQAECARPPPPPPMTTPSSSGSACHRSGTHGAVGATQGAASPTDAVTDVTDARRRVLYALWPAVLGERLIDGLPQAPPAGGLPPPRRDVITPAVLSARWVGAELQTSRLTSGGDADDAADDPGGNAQLVESDLLHWNPTIEESTIEQTHATMRESAQMRSNARAVKALTALSTSASDAEGGMRLLVWLLHRVPARLTTVELAKALIVSPAPEAGLIIPPEILRTGLSNRADVELLASLAEYAHGRQTLVGALLHRGRSGGGPKGLVQGLRFLRLALPLSFRKAHAYSTPPATLHGVTYNNRRARPLLGDSP
jgi:hypothetical protein